MIAAGGARFAPTKVATLLAAMFAVVALIFGLLPQAFAQTPTVSKIGLDTQVLSSPARTGEDVIFQANLSCSADSGGCGTPTIRAEVPQLEPNWDGTIAKLTVNNATDADGVEYKGLETLADGTQVLSWQFTKEFEAGSTTSFGFPLRSKNVITGANTNVDVTFKVYEDEDATQPLAESTKTGTYTAQYDPRVAITPTQKQYPPAIGYPFSLQVSTGISDVVNPEDGSVGVWRQPLQGQVGITDVRQQVTLPVGVKFSSASGNPTVTENPDGTTLVSWDESASSDASTDGNTWTSGWDGQTIDVIYTDLYNEGDVVTATSTYRNLVTGEEGSTSDTLAITPAEGPTGAGSLAKTERLLHPSFTARNFQGSWELRANNTGNIPLRWQVTDMLPCPYVSPTDTNDTTCATPAFTTLSLQNNSTNTRDSIVVNWTTNTGRTGQTTLAYPERQSIELGEGEWVTKLDVDQLISPGARMRLIITGTINPEIEQKGTKEVGNYRNPEVLASEFFDTPERQRDTTVLENCVDSAKLINPVNNTVVSEADLLCGYLKLAPDALKIWGQVAISENLARQGGTMPVDITLNPWLSTQPWTPVFATLLPEGISYVPDSLTGVSGPLKDVQPVVEVIPDYQNTGRELVRFTYPDDAKLQPPTTNTKLRFDVAISQEVAVGRQNIEVKFFDKFVSNSEPLRGYTICDAHGATDTTTDDATNYSGLDRTGDRACPWTASFVVLPPFNAKLVKQVKGALDAGYSISTTDNREHPQNPVGLTTAGGENVYNITITNNESTGMKDVVFYDLLPTVGDTGTGPLSDTARNSQWRPEFVRIENLPEGATVEYSTAANPCRGEVMEPRVERAEGPSGCEDSWTTYEPTNPSAVTALRFSLGDRTIAPQEMVSFRVIVKTPDYETSKQVAWNSAAVASTNAATGTAFPAYEPNKVGLRISDLAVDNKSSAQCFPADATEAKVQFTVTVRNLSPSVRSLVVAQQLPEGVKVDAVRAQLGGQVFGSDDAVEITDANNSLGGITTSYNKETNLWSITNLGTDEELTLIVDATVELPEDATEYVARLRSVVTTLNGREVEESLQIDDRTSVRLVHCDVPETPTTSEQPPSETTTPVEPTEPTELSTPIIPIPIPVPEPNTPGSSGSSNSSSFPPATASQVSAPEQNNQPKKGLLANTGVNLTLVLVLAGFSFAAGLLLTRNRREA